MTRGLALLQVLPLPGLVPGPLDTLASGPTGSGPSASATSLSLASASGRTGPAAVTTAQASVAEAARGSSSEGAWPIVTASSASPVSISCAVGLVDSETVTVLPRRLQLDFGGKPDSYSEHEGPDTQAGPGK